jgi:hypothetical protein
MAVQSMIRSGAAAAFAAIFTIGALGDWYEPSYEWLMPLSVVALGAAIGRWWALWLAFLPVLLAIPEGTGGDPPAVPAAAVGAILGAGLLAVGVVVSKAVDHALALRAGGSQR